MLNIIDDVIPVKITLERCEHQGSSSTEIEAVLLLKDGDVYTQESGGPNEEGYSYTTAMYARDGDTVTLGIDTTSRDCDGRLDRHDLMTWRESDGLNQYGYPNWSEEEAFNRDYEAERAGY